MIKLGRVAKVNKDATVQVVFEDRGNFQTQDIQVMHQRTKDDKHYHMPSEGEWVTVAFFENCPDRGVVLGSVYTDDNSPPASDDRYKMLFKDGTYFEYDKTTKTANLDCVGTVNVNAIKEIVLKAPLIKFDGEVETTKSIKVANNGTFGGKVDVTASISAGQGITAIGTVGGAKIESKGDVITKKGSIDNHTHKESTGATTSQMIGGA